VSFDYQPTLRGPLIHLRPLLPSDHDALYAVASDQLIWEQHPAKERAEPEGFRRFFQHALDSGGAFLITKAGTGQVIGSSRFHGYNESAREVEIGWTFLAREHWGGEYNRELKRLMLEHAFRFVESVVFLISPTNIRSQKGTMKIGAVRDGSRVNERGEESWVFRLTRGTNP
jgi:RimJ/RimL family protein N-acetyltransferase